jgi:hypothetical protein
MKMLSRQKAGKTGYADRLFSGGSFLLSAFSLNESTVL